MSLSANRKRFIKLHEVGHEVLPWQQELYDLFEDNTFSVSSDAREEFETEASFFASAVLFQTYRFEDELKKLPLSLKSAMVLGDKFGTSKHAAIRRYVEYSPKRCALVVLSNPTRESGISLRNVFYSAKFKKQFGEISFEQMIGLDTPYIQDVVLGKKLHERGLLRYTGESIGFIEFNYHFFNNTYNSFVLIMPKGEHIRSRTSIVVS